MKKNNKENNKKNILNLIIEIILIVIIILLLVHDCRLQKINNEYKNKKIPTGNVDVIEIMCDSSSTKCKKEPKDDASDGSSTISAINTIPKNSGSTKDETSDASEKDEKLEGFIVDDDYTITWNGTQNLKIFANPAYEFMEKIAPESSNTYKFVVKNKTSYNLKYKITFVETNPHSINLKYKLKKNGSYIKSDYVSYNDINIKDQVISANGEDTYYLDWKWISSSNDTQIGKIQANYKLNIEVEAESINE